MSAARMARAAALLLVLCAAAVSPAVASRTPAALFSSGRSLLQEQSSCCALVDATATGGSVACGSSGLVLTVPSAEFAPIAASISVKGKAGTGNTATMSTASLAGQTCSTRFGAATWGTAGDATTLAVAAGADTTCSTGTDGSCQGLVNAFGGVANVAISGRHSCTIRATDGAVLCSGNNQFGQLGTGTTTASASLVAALAPGSGSGILTGATQIAAGGRPELVALSGHTCACLSSGQAACWGQNTFGQVAAAISTATTSVTRPTVVMTDAAGTAPLANCKSVAANLNHTLFLTTTGDIYAAGRNGYSELGLGTFAVTNYAAQVPRASVGNKAATAVSVGKRHSCAVFEDNTVACVGANGNGQLGRGTSGPTPAQDWGFVAGINDAVDVQCGELSTCVLRKGGKVSCWGYGVAVGNGAAANSLTPVETLSGRALKLAAGDQHACAIMDDASVTCWGRGAVGQLADGQATPPSAWMTPQTSTFVGAMSIHAGGNTTCSINGLGQRLCAGNNQYSQFAKAASAINTSPVATVIPADLAPSSFTVPTPFVAVSDAANAPVCTLLLSVKVAATCDPTPPVFSPALEDITVDATSADGAVVTYSPTAEDEGVPVDVTCIPASGSQFAVGSTTVTCKAGVTTGTFAVTVAAAPPAFAANAPTAAFEATTTTGTSVAGKYTPRAFDPVDGDLSASVETYLVSTNQLISLSGPNAYIFPVGATQILNSVTNSFGVGAEELVTIVVVAPTPVFAGNAPTAAFEATTTTGTSVAGKYAPRASDPVDGDLSDTVQTYLAATNQLISLSGPNAYIFPVGATQILNSVTNSFGVGAEELVTIVVVVAPQPAAPQPSAPQPAAPLPVLTVPTTPVVVTQPDKAPAKTVRYQNACTATGTLEAVTITYNPPSGQTVGTAPFTVGSTATVTCTATTASGSTASGTFTVVVRRPPGQDGENP